jgi:glyoxylase-like metal-dependent hydrolase (beta-lactamase superfamily II)
VSVAIDFREQQTAIASSVWRTIPIHVDQRLKDGDKVRLGEVELTLHHHPGHTKGASSFTYTAQDAGKS